ncbi:MAG: DUF4397 domain-containing protein [Gemmatimonadales bacterium]
MNSHRIVAALLGAIVLASCEKNAVQVLPSAELPGARIKFFNFGVGAPAVNFYANDTKVTAIGSGTGSESSSGVAYGGGGAGGVYTGIAPGQHTLTGRISAAGADKNLPIATLPATIEDGKYYSFYMSGIYNTTTKTSDAFIVEDPVVPPTDYTTAQVRFVQAISNATNLLTLYALNTTDSTTTTIGGPIAYKAASGFTAVPAGIYNLYARYTDSTTNKVSRNAVTILGGRMYTIGARGNITVASGTTAPALDNTANR